MRQNRSACNERAERFSREGREDGRNRSDTVEPADHPPADSTPDGGIRAQWGDDPVPVALEMGTEHPPGRVVSAPAECRARSAPDYPGWGGFR